MPRSRVVRGDASPLADAICSRRRRNLTPRGNIVTGTVSGTVMRFARSRTGQRRRRLLKGMERETGIEPATSGLGSLRSTAELLPHQRQDRLRFRG